MAVNVFTVESETRDKSSLRLEGRRLSPTRLAFNYKRATITTGKTNSREDATSIVVLFFYEVVIVDERGLIARSSL